MICCWYCGEKFEKPNQEYIEHVFEKHENPFKDFKDEDCYQDSEE